ncbi:MAG TPA: hypothetical protein VGD17_09350 [Chitinophagaceae bacterium]
MKAIKIAGWVLVLFTLGCSSSKIIHSWKAENAQAKKFNKIMVLGLIGNADISLRQKMEDHLINDLREIGYTAFSSLQEYGPKAFDKIDEQTALDKLSNSGVDAVVTVVLLNKSKERHYVPGHLRYTPYSVYYDRFWGYYTTIYGRVYSPGYYEENTRYFWESSLYDMGAKELVYSVQTESFEPSSAERLGHEYGQLIVNDMIKRNILVKQTSSPKLGF